MEPPLLQPTTDSSERADQQLARRHQNGNQCLLIMNGN